MAKKKISTTKLLILFLFLNCTAIEIFTGYVTVMNLRYLNTNDLGDSPYGGPYNLDYSYVAVKLVNNKYTYFVQLVTCVEGTETCAPNDANNWRGIDLVNVHYSNDKGFTVK